MKSKNTNLYKYMTNILYLAILSELKSAGATRLSPFLLRNTHTNSGVFTSGPNSLPFAFRPSWSTSGRLDANFSKSSGARICEDRFSFIQSALGGNVLLMNTLMTVPPPMDPSDGKMLAVAIGNIDINATCHEMFTRINWTDVWLNISSNLAIRIRLPVDGNLQGHPLT